MVSEFLGRERGGRRPNRPDQDGVSALRVSWHERSCDLEPVWAGTGLPADFIGRDVRGKAAVIYGFPDPGGRENTAMTFGAVANADRAGAAAILVVLGFPGNVTNEPAGGQTTAPASVPVFVIGNQDGTAIREMIEKQQSPKLHVRLDVEMKSGLKSASVFGVLPGATDEQVIVQAHTDSFFEGAMDNASGIATQLTLAEHFSSIPKAAAQPHDDVLHDVGASFAVRTRRRHAVDQGEHERRARENSGAGQLRAHRSSGDVCVRRVAGGVQYGQRAAMVRRRERSIEAIVAKTFHEYGIALYSRPEVRPGGELGPMSTEAPSFHIIDQTVYHTDLDTLQAVPAYGLEQSARAFAKIIDEVNKLPLTSLRVNIPSGN